MGRLGYMGPETGLQGKARKARVTRNVAGCGSRHPGQGKEEGKAVCSHKAWGTELVVMSHPPQGCWGNPRGCGKEQARQNGHRWGCSTTNIQGPINKYKAM